MIKDFSCADMASKQASPLQKSVLIDSSPVECNFPIMDVFVDDMKIVYGLKIAFQEVRASG
jgi:hypothetical protein